jgi:CAAX amino terminal protease family.
VVSTLTIVVGIGIATAGYPVAWTLNDRLDPFESVETWLRSDVTKWVVLAVVVGFVLGVEGRSLASIGVRPPVELPVVGGLVPTLGGGAVVGHLGTGLGWSVVGFVGILVVGSGVYRLYERFGLETPEEVIDEQASRGVASYLTRAVSAGVMESVLYQGYLISRVTELSGSVAVAAVFAWIAFTAVHSLGDTYGPAATVYIGVPAVGLVLLYVACESVVVVCFVHAVVNALSFLTE